ncbi:hypothetical protein CC80DRAFT_458231 [Byssothecium circinans]|uniref:Pentatricopeptide repeat-containing protein-mitochondrial domain-containing protein n=1 Tax=Byssothecium circinans TaxID=147558 RepID=A0A6A5TJB7_9PLEO|nr:hypothetical protein CC80DRAFT_458231 [Byssothecium circinans]
MPPRPIINDALWRCLCPRYTQLPYTSHLPSAGKGATPARNRIPRTASPRRPTHQLRAYNTSTQSPPGRDVFGTYGAGAMSPQKRADSASAHRSLKENVPMHQLPTSALYDRLRIDGAAGKHEEVMNIIRILIKDRREVPNTAMYTAVLHSCANCQAVTAGAIRKILQEMQENGIELDGRGAECVLEALAVHSDYMLRTDILEYMKERWFDLSDRAHNFVVAGMLRDRLFEQALEKLEDMIRNRIKVELWLWDKTIWMLLEFGEIEEAFYVLSLRQNVEGQDIKLTGVMWLQLLDAAGKKHLADAAVLIWNMRVIPGYLKPPTGTCLNMLSIAARTGNVKLGTDVFRILTERDTVLNTHHYEALIECYLNASDIFSAFSVVVIMQDSGLRIAPEALHPLITYLTQSESRPMEAFKTLQTLSSGGRKVPLVAVNACIRGCFGAKDKDIHMTPAVEIYKALHTVCPTGPDIQTFNILLAGCGRSKRKELAMFLANEMIQLGIKPDAITYDRLIIVCLNVYDYEDAMLYYEEMRGMGWVPRETTWDDLIVKSTQMGDPRAVAALKDLKELGGADPGRLAVLERLVHRRFEQGVARAGTDKAREEEEEGRRMVMGEKGDMTVEEDGKESLGTKSFGHGDLM